MDSLTKANINLYAILRNLEQLCEFDPEAGALAKAQDLTMSLKVSGGPQATLSFQNGKVTFKRGIGSGCDIKLFFRSPEHLIDMFDGRANPVILKGLTKVKFLTGNFSKLTDRLSYFLKPTDELLADPTYFKINTYLTAYTAFYALAEIANNDALGKINAKRVPDGVIAVRAEGGPEVYLIVKDAHFEANIGRFENPRSIMSFGNLETVNAILNGKSDIYTAIGQGNFAVRGFIPMLDNLSKLLDQVGPYVK